MAVEHMAAENNKPTAIKTKTDEYVLKLFWTLSEGQDNARIKASNELVKHLTKKQENSEESKTDELCPTLVYTLERLIKGLSSGRKWSRLGFSLALTQILRNLDVPVKQVLDLTEKHLHFSSHDQKQECGGLMLGQAFVYLSLIQSHRLIKDEEFECASVMTSHSQDVKHVIWHPNKEILASCSYDDTIKLYKEDNDDWTCFQTLASHDSTVWKICFDQSGSRLASCSDDKTVKIWQEYLPGNEEGIVTHGSDSVWKCVCTLSGYHERAVYDINWNHVTGHLVTACGDDSIRVFGEDADSNKNEPKFSLMTMINHAHSQDVNSVSWNPKIPNLLASCSDDNLVKLWRYVE